MPPSPCWPLSPSRDSDRAVATIIDLAMFDVQERLCSSNQAMNYMLSGKHAAALRATATPISMPQQVFNCRDGHVVLGGWQR